MERNNIKQFVIEWIEQNKSIFHQSADCIWSYPELGMEEFKSSALLADLLEKNGFSVKKKVADMPTAFVATYGSGKPVIGFSVEYDCLPGLSQKISAEKNPVIEGAPGHGCGHNLLGAGAIEAAIALKEALKHFNLAATIKVFGTPAEELCVGKPFMARSGLFEGVDAFLDWHPWHYNRADYDTCNAYFSIYYHFKGRTSHGNAPWYGRSALDAAMLQAHAVEMLREHIPPGTADAANTINYTFSDVGPEFPSVVSDRATAWYIGRITTAEEAANIISRIHKCAEAAAMATETEVVIELISATHEKIPNKTLAEVVHKNLDTIGTPKFTKEEHEFAKKMQRNAGVADTGLMENILPFGSGGTAVCDTSEYSWHAPYATAWISMAPPGVGFHNWMVTACAGSSIGKKSMDTAAKVLAASAIDLVQYPKIIENAKNELKERLAGRSYKSLIPDSVKPPFKLNCSAMEKYRPLYITK
ncbi:aminobenzoyl-glutamate utilization protein B [Desulfotomaculum arcticum]|uniref:Aminobenzoyl-glutamate utilization protein B n=1 Tax=Desulfotruncus arcticus DSM 17038 TaxID=1121424 RepID=A0A1I2PKV8_9FIRM|nr:amidohydrolase [Desulfotruncus arcticus]SFG14266.1 aminobenzoyl-glutamate utilization protein B [Desulfotomaculum arcticum] [Desulfotruncus arcticus DSM 17038]